MSKTRTGFRRAHCLAPVAGGGGYLLSRLGSVNRPFRGFATFPRSLGFDRKNHRGLPREALQVRDDSIEAREHTHFISKIKHQVGAAITGPI